MNSGLKVSNTKPTKTWDEFGIKGEQYETHRNLGMNSELKVSNTKPTKNWDELGIKGQQYETH